MIGKVTSYLKEVRAELKKVNWPSRADTTKYTIGVILISAALAIFFAGLDYIFSLVLERFIL